MKKRIAVLSVILAAAAIVAVPLVHAEPGPGRGGAHRGFGGLAYFHRLDRIADELELSDQQVDEIKAIFEAVHDQNRQYREQLHGGMRAAAETLLANPNDLAGAQAQLDAQLAAEKAIKSNMIAATAKALNVLTADQRTKLKEHVEEQSERRTRRRR